MYRTKASEKKVKYANTIKVKIKQTNLKKKRWNKEHPYKIYNYYLLTKLLNGDQYNYTFLFMIVIMKMI